MSRIDLDHVLTVLREGGDVADTERAIKMIEQAKRERQAILRHNHALAAGLSAVAKDETLGLMMVENVDGDRAKMAQTALQKILGDLPEITYFASILGPILTFLEERPDEVRHFVTAIIHNKAGDRFDLTLQKVGAELTPVTKLRLAESAINRVRSLVGALESYPLGESEREIVADVRGAIDGVRTSATAKPVTIGPDDPRWSVLESGDYHEIDGLAGAAVTIEPGPRRAESDAFRMVELVRTKTNPVELAPDYLTQRVAVTLGRLVLKLPACDACGEPATRAWGRGGGRWCENHATQYPEPGAPPELDPGTRALVTSYPRADALLFAIVQVGAVLGEDWRAICSSAA